MEQPRVEALRKTLAEKNIDALLVSNYYNILYLSGFKTLVDNEREAWLLITQNDEYLFTDYRYSSTAHNIRFLTPEKRLIKHLQEIIDEKSIKTLGFEAEDLKYYECQGFKKSLEKTTLVETHGLVIKQREIKDAGEVAKIKSACEISDRCLKEVAKGIRVGQTEKEISFKIEFWLKEKGYDLAFYPIVAVDENSAIPHYDTRAGDDKKINNGSIILIDFGAKHDDYLSDVTRMVFAGKPRDEIVNQYQSLNESQSKTLKHLKVGESLKSADSFCRGVMKERGLADYSHSTGHGVGVEIHEFPKMSYVSEDVVVPGQVITVEPGFYLPGKWGMRIEDTVLINKTDAETLTKFTKDLLVI
jgi:Xaa-Pro aminopeptidase